MKELVELKELLFNSALNGEIRVFEGYASFTTVDFNFYDIDENLLYTFYKKIDFYIDEPGYEVDENDIFTSNQQVKIVNNIFKFEFEEIQSKDNFDKFIPNKSSKNVSLIEIVIGDKISDGTYDDLCIVLSVKFL